MQCFLTNERVNDLSREENFNLPFKSAIPYKATSGPSSAPDLQ